MNANNLIIAQIRQRLEILYQMVEELETSGGSDTYTKAQIDALLAPYEGIEETDDNYIEMKSGVRLYITNTTPTGTIPSGSIGVGF